MLANNIFFTGCLHLNHEAILGAKGRSFATLHEMHCKIYDNWNYNVRPEDTVWVLGDVYFGTDLKFLRKYITNLHGTKYLIKGNHDTLPPKNYINVGFAKYYDLPLVFNRDLILSHEPLLNITGDGFINIHAHTHGRPFTMQSDKHFCVSQECFGMAPISYQELMKRKAII